MTRLAIEAPSTNWLSEVKRVMNLPRSRRSEMSAERRIRVATEKAATIRRLCEGPAARFETFADALAHAAAIGLRDGRFCPISKPAKEPGPIDLQVFLNRSHGALI